MLIIILVYVKYKQRGKMGTFSADRGYKNTHLKVKVVSKFRLCI